MLPLSTLHMAALTALVAALLWGAGDFSGGLATRRGSPFQIIVLAHGADVVLLALLAWAIHSPIASATALGWGLASGLVNGIALACFYLALAASEMGISAALAGLLTAALPAAAGILLQGLPTPRQIAGFLLAFPAIWLIARSPSKADAATQRRSLILATVAGLGFGVFLIFSRQASRDEIVWPLLASRFGSALVAAGLLALVQRRTVTASARPDRALLLEKLRWQPITSFVFWLAMSAGLFDAVGNMAYMESTRLGRLDIAAVLASLYPAGTILLAMIFLRERTSKTQALGMALALTAVALIAR
jgi:drug/metabolite transporter (DMT)-like permease